MVTGNVGLPYTPIVREKKRTFYRLHPNNFGEVMVCRNLPIGVSTVVNGIPVSYRERYLGKGMREKPEELMPDAKLETNPEGGMFLVPDGYELKLVPEKTEFERKQIDTETWKVVKKESTPTVEGGFKCPECGKEVATKLALNGHMRSHNK